MPASIIAPEIIEFPFLVFAMRAMYQGIEIDHPVFALLFYNLSFALNCKHWYTSNFAYGNLAPVCFICQRVLPPVPRHLLEHHLHFEVCLHIIILFTICNMTHFDGTTIKGSRSFLRCSNGLRTVKFFYIEVSRTSPRCSL